jgi:hypothetical protein
VKRDPVPFLVVGALCAFSVGMGFYSYGAKRGTLNAAVLIFVLWPSAFYLGKKYPGLFG